MSQRVLDMGHGVTLRFVQWAPDRKLNPRWVDIPDVERYGARITHPRADGSECDGFVTFDGEVQRRIEPDVPKWTVTSWEPLTLEPSVLCRRCGHHGFIRNGKWVPA